MHNYKVQIGAASEKNSNQDLHRNHFKIRIKYKKNLKEEYFH